MHKFLKSLKIEPFVSEVAISACEGDIKALQYYKNKIKYHIKR